MIREYLFIDFLQNNKYKRSVLMTVFVSAGNNKQSHGDTCYYVSRNIMVRYSTSIRHAAAHRNHHIIEQVKRSIPCSAIICARPWEEKRGREGERKEEKSWATLIFQYTLVLWWHMLFYTEKTWHQNTLDNRKDPQQDPSQRQKDGLQIWSEFSNIHWSEWTKLTASICDSMGRL